MSKLGYISRSGFQTTVFPSSGRSNTITSNPVSKSFKPAMLPKDDDIIPDIVRAPLTFNNPRVNNNRSDLVKEGFFDVVAPAIEEPSIIPPSTEPSPIDNIIPGSREAIIDSFKKPQTPVSEDLISKITDLPRITDILPSPIDNIIPGSRESIIDSFIKPQTPVREDLISKITDLPRITDILPSPIDNIIPGSREEIIDSIIKPQTPVREDLISKITDLPSIKDIVPADLENTLPGSREAIFTEFNIITDRSDDSPLPTLVDKIVDLPSIKDIEPAILDDIMPGNKETIFDPPTNIYISPFENDPEAPPVTPVTENYGNQAGSYLYSPNKSGQGMFLQPHQDDGAGGMNYGNNLTENTASEASVGAGSLKGLVIAGAAVALLSVFFSGEGAGDKMLKSRKSGVPSLRQGSQKKTSLKGTPAMVMN